MHITAGVYVSFYLSPSFQRIYRRYGELGDYRDDSNMMQSAADDGVEVVA